jgi:hypothetical protein
MPNDQPAPGPSFPGFERSKDQALIGDSIGEDLVSARAAAVLRYRERPAESTVLVSSSHKDYCVCICEYVALTDRLGHEFLEHDVRRCVQIKTADLTMIVTMSEDRLGVGTISFPEPLARGPLVVFSEDVMIDVLEELELDGFAESIGRLDSIEDDPTRRAREMLVEKTNRAAEDPGQVGLPFVPLFGLEVAPGHAPSGAIYGMEVIANRPREIPSSVEVRRDRQGILAQFPIEQARGIGRVILRITATRQVANDASTPFGIHAGIGPLQSKLGFAYSRRAGHHGERTW